MLESFGVPVSYFLHDAYVYGLTMLTVYMNLELIGLVLGFGKPWPGE